MARWLNKVAEMRGDGYGVYPIPEDSRQAPVWENYVLAQAAQATLGLIPLKTVALGVGVDGRNVELRFLVTERTDEDDADIAAIADELLTLTGEVADISTSVEVVDERRIGHERFQKWSFIFWINERTQLTAL